MKSKQLTVKSRMPEENNNFADFPLLPVGWKMTTLGSVVGTIIDNRGRNPDFYSTNGIPVIDNALITGERRIDLNQAKRFIDEDIYSSFIRKYTREGDILITLVGNGYGNIALSPKEKSVIIQNTIGLRCNNLSDNKFIFYYLSLKKKLITDLNIGAAQPSVKVGDLMNIAVFFPPFSEQRAIAAVLSSLDDKIELLREQNKTLEAIAQAIFKEWFVNFNFPDKTGKPYRASGGKMVDSELGEIPEGWRVDKLEKIVCHIKEQVEPFKQPIATFKHYSIPSFDQNQKPEKSLGSTILSNKYSIKNNCFLVSKLNPKIPRIWAVINPGENSICSTEFQVILSKEKHHFCFIYFVLKSDNFTQEFASKAKGTSGSHQRTSPQDILDYELVIPENEVITKFENCAGHVLLKIENNHSQVQSIASLRDALLPKLMKGEVRVKDFSN